jgi:hypothetical protein
MRERGLAFVFASFGVGSRVVKTRPVAFSTLTAPQLPGTRNDHIRA